MSANVRHNSFASLPDQNSFTELHVGMEDPNEHPEYIWEITQLQNYKYRIRNTRFPSYAGLISDPRPDSPSVCGVDNAKHTMWNIKPQELPGVFSIGSSDEHFFWCMDGYSPHVSLSSHQSSPETSWMIQPVETSENSCPPSTSNLSLGSLSHAFPYLGSVHLAYQCLAAKALKAFTSTDPQAAKVINPTHLQALVRLLDSPDPTVASAAVEAVEVISTHAPEKAKSIEEKVIPSLIRFLSFEEVEVQNVGANTLRKMIDREPKPRIDQHSIPILCNHLRSPNIAVQTAACCALGSFPWGPDIKPGNDIVQALKACLNSPNHELQNSARTALCQIESSVTLVSPARPIPTRPIPTSPAPSIRQEHSKALQVKVVQYSVKINDDKGSGASKDLYTYKPDLCKDWYYLGPAAANSDSTVLRGVIVKELEAGILVDVKDWVRVWDDTGAFHFKDYSLWRGVPPSLEYVVLASFFVRSKDKPTPGDVKGIKAVRKDFLAPAEVGRQIWDDEGTWADKDGSVWDVSVESAHGFLIKPGAFIAVDGRNKRPGDVYALDTTRVQLSK